MFFISKLTEQKIDLYVHFSISIYIVIIKSRDLIPDLVEIYYNFSIPNHHFNIDRKSSRFMNSRYHVGINTILFILYVLWKYGSLNTSLSAKVHQPLHSPVFLCFDIEVNVGYFDRLGLRRKYWLVHIKHMF